MKKCPSMHLTICALQTQLVLELVKKTSIIQLKRTRSGCNFVLFKDLYRVDFLARLTPISSFFKTLSSLAKWLSILLTD